MNLIRVDEEIRTPAEGSTSPCAATTPRPPNKDILKQITLMSN